MSIVCPVKATIETGATCCAMVMNDLLQEQWEQTDSNLDIQHPPKITTPEWSHAAVAYMSDGVRENGASCNRIYQFKYCTLVDCPFETFMVPK